MDKQLFLFLAVLTVASLTQASKLERQRRDIEQLREKWIFEDLAEISSAKVKRAANLPNNAGSTSKPTRGKSARKVAGDSPITYVKPLTQKSPGTSDKLSEVTTTESPTTEEFTPDSSSEQPYDTVLDPLHVPESTTAKATPTTPNPRSTAAKTTTKPPLRRTKPTSDSTTKSPASTKPAESEKPNDNAEPNNLKNAPDRDKKRSDPSSNVIPGVGSRSNFDEESTTKPSDEKPKDLADKTNASPINSQTTPSLQTAEETFDFPNYGPGFGPNPGPGIGGNFGYPGYNPSPNAGNYAWTHTGPSSAGASAGAFASAGASSVAGPGFPTLPNNNQGSHAYNPNSMPLVPDVGSRGSFPESNQPNPNYNSYGGIGQPSPGAPTFAEPHGYQNEVYPGYNPNYGGAPNYGPSAGYYNNQPYGPYVPNNDFGYNPFGMQGGAFSDGFPHFSSADDMIRQIQDQIRAQQESIDAQIRAQQNGLANNAWAAASLTNVGSEINPYTYARTQTSPDYNTNFYPSYDSVGNGAYDYGGLGGSHGGPQSAISSISVGPQGGYQAGQISPVGPGIESRFGEELPAPKGNRVAVFASSKSSSRVGPDGKVHSHKSATTGFNDNGQVYVKTVHDP